MIDYMDEQIARVIKHLKETEEYDNTLILFFCDNGVQDISADLSVVE